MPIYDFDCTECSHEFELHVAYDERLNTECPACAAHAKVVWRSSQRPVLFREDKYQIEFGERKGVHCSSKRQLLDQIKYANEKNPNPIELMSEYYG